MASTDRIAGGAGLKAVLAAAALIASPAAGEDRVDRWAAEITQASLRFGVPEAWIRRVMRSESGGETFRDGQPIISRAGAMGLMQLMPATWREMRSSFGLGSDPHDPADNILAGAAYLRLMYDRFGYPGLFDAYNAGPARYAAYLAGARPLPAETRSYVAVIALGTRGPSSIAGAAQRGRVPAAIGRACAARGCAIFPAVPAGLFVQLGSAERR